MNRLFNRPVRAFAEDDARVTRLYHETRQSLLAFLMRRCTTAEDAADCLAETYRVAWEKRSRIPPGDQGRAWLFGVARNAARESRRYGERRAATSRALALAAEHAYTAPTDQDDALAAALSTLSSLDREIVTMISADDLPPRAVAVILGLSPNVVRVRAHRARAKLRSAMARQESEDDADSNRPLPSPR